MRSLILPLCLALLGFGFLVYMTLPPNIQEEAPATVLLSGRLTDGAAGPMANQVFQGTLSAGGQSLDFEGTTDAAGRFEVTGTTGVPALFVLFLWTRDERSSVNRFSRRNVDLATLVADDIGDFAMGTLTSLASGKVADAEGKPVDHASFSIRSVDAEVSIAEFPVDGFSDSLGYFELYGLRSEQEVALHVTAEGFAGQVVDTLGDELSIVLQRQ
ncbi:MAG: hypothetical protein ACI8QS_001962 [Planctomycetota bacterium]|jgi:hypothetical protein